jgi:hypothetical protein
LAYILLKNVHDIFRGAMSIESDVRTSFGLSARSAVHYEAGSPLKSLDKFAIIPHHLIQAVGGTKIHPTKQQPRTVVAFARGMETASWYRQVTSTVMATLT